ncbi:MAG: T9SS type A sorting domain-containing protein, partial [Saprospiraceae bacterium]|nr:T9SS type A sorting domain-containing protein [Saprospiraceae bacterium]
RLYPNPAAGLLQVAYSGETSAQFALYHGTGALALQQPLSANAATAVEVGVLPPGVYIAVVSADGALVCRELVEVMR